MASLYSANMERNQDATVYVGNLDPQARSGRPVASFANPALCLAGTASQPCIVRGRIAVRRTGYRRTLVGADAPGGPSWYAGTRLPVHAQLNRNRAGRAVNVHVPKDKISGTHNNFGFVEFRSEEVGASTARKIRAELAWPSACGCRTRTIALTFLT